MNILWIVGSIVLGGLVGASINYIADVFPATRRLGAPKCVVCATPQPWWGYFSLSPCAVCGARRSRRVWIVAFGCAAAAVGLLLWPGGRISFWPGLVWLLYFGIVIVIDGEHRLILNEMSLVGLVLAAITGTAMHGWIVTALGGAAGLLIMFTLYLAGIGFAKLLGRMRGQVIEEEALGFGDVTLATVLGLLLGLPNIIFGLTYAMLIGGFASLAVIVVNIARRRYEAFQAIPYGPFLVIGAVIAYLVK